VIPKEFERSNLAFGLKAGKKRLELVLHGLTDEQCGMAGALRSDSIGELVLHKSLDQMACRRLTDSQHVSNLFDARRFEIPNDQQRFHLRQR